MNGKHFYAIAAAILIFMGALLFWSTPSRAENEWKKEAWITEWCKKLETIDTFMALLANSNSMASEFIRTMLQNDQCVKAPPGWLVAFSPQEIVRRYPKMNPTKQDAVVMRGRLINPDDTLGKEAFVIILTSKLWRFHDKKAPQKVPGKGHPAENGVRYQEA